MILARPEKPVQDAPPSSPAEAHADPRGLLVRKDLVSQRRPPEPGSEPVPSEAHALVERVSATSTGEIDKLIGQLQTLREFFHNEGQRIQRELAQYAQLGDAMMKSTKTMAENMAQLKHTVEASQDEAE